jgi:hypothetical protein
MTPLLLAALALEAAVATPPPQRKHPRLIVDIGLAASTEAASAWLSQGRSKA